MSNPHLNLSTDAGVVVIGHNEGERLRHCLNSLGQTRPVVYVDSGSTDDSISVATSLGAKAIELDRSQPFTAARGRNAGWHALLEIAPNIEFIQFIDGDCTIADGWIDGAVEYLHSYAAVAIVCGRRREIVPTRNWYHRLADMEWDTPVGEAKYCGGDALIRVEALLQVNGYRDDLIAGEEPELCVRLRASGWKIWRLDHDMTHHDIRMTSFGQWWKRCMRSGYAYAEGAALHGAPPERHWVRESRSIWIWGFGLPLVAIAFAWPTHGVSMIVFALGYLALFAKVVAHSIRQGRASISSSALYAGSCVVAKWPQAIGQLRYWANRQRRRAVGPD